MKKPTVGIEQDPSGERFLTIGCPDCQETNRYPFSSLAADSTIECKCGVGFNISAQNIEDLKQHYGFDAGTDSSN